MISIVRTIFGRLHALDPNAEEARLLVNEEEPQHGEINVSMSTNATDTGDFVSQESEGVTSAAQENATLVTLGNTESSAVAGVELPPQTPSTPRPCKHTNLILCFLS
jgi:brefeldin A-resistance guanine nucleotide exchange factor 1